MDGYRLNTVITTSDFDSLPSTKAAYGVAAVGNDVSSYSTYYLDHFRRQRRPTTTDLVKHYNRIIYACATINSESKSQVPLRLYVKTAKGDKKPRTETRQLKSAEIDRLCKLPFLQGRLKEFHNVEEVVNHQAIKLLEKFNESPFINGYSANVFTQLYQEVSGRAYWYVETDNLNRPTNLWILPSQYVWPIKESDSKKIVDRYEFRVGSKTINYDPEEIIQFLMPNLQNPYLEGISPLEAAYESVLVSDKLISHESSFLDNEARPDAILSPGKDAVIGPDEAERWEKKFNQKFARGGGGKLFVAEESVEVKPLTYPPRDLARLEIHKWSKLEIVNAFGCPIALFDAQNINRATLEAAMVQHAIYAIKPRCDRHSAILNDRLLPFFDTSERLFFAYDDPVPTSRELKLQEVVQLKVNGIITPNEARDEYDYPPVSGGDELEPQNVSSTLRENERGSGQAEK